MIRSAKVCGALLWLAAAGAAAVPAHAQNKELSDKSVLTLMRYAWSMVPDKFTTPLGKTIVVDFTADWCINCKFLKRTVLDRDPVRARITGDNYVLLEVDNTSSSAPGWKYLESLGQTGVPTLAIYGPAISKPIILNAYTPATVMDALDRAEGKNGDPNAATNPAPQPENAPAPPPSSR